jgi:hypothetical protein
MQGETATRRVVCRCAATPGDAGESDGSGFVTPCASSRCRTAVTGTSARSGSMMPTTRTSTTGDAEPAPLRLDDSLGSARRAPTGLARSAALARPGLRLAARAHSTRQVTMTAKLTTCPRWCVGHRSLGGAAVCRRLRSAGRPCGLLSPSSLQRLRRLDAHPSLPPPSDLSPRPSVEEIDEWTPTP